MKHFIGHGIYVYEQVKFNFWFLSWQRREAFLNFSEGLETGASKRLHTSEHLRQLADEYEASKLLCYTIFCSSVL